MSETLTSYKLPLPIKGPTSSGSYTITAFEDPKGVNAAGKRYYLRIQAEKFVDAAAKKEKIKFDEKHTRKALVEMVLNELNRGTNNE